MAQRLFSYSEVELGYSADQAILEAQRCLVCGPCSECLACVRACKVGAVVHEQSTQIVPLQIGAVIYAGEPAGCDQLPISDGQGLYRAQPDSALHGSAAAAQAMFDLFADSPGHATAAAASPAGMPRIGVFICQCGDQIAHVVDTETVRQHALRPDVVQAQVLPFSCSPEAAETILKAITDRGLTGLCWLPARAVQSTRHTKHPTASAARTI
jgi:ferredoxin